MWHTLLFQIVTKCSRVLFDIAVNIGKSLHKKFNLEFTGKEFQIYI